MPVSQTAGQTQLFRFERVGVKVIKPDVRYPRSQGQQEEEETEAE